MNYIGETITNFINSTKELLKEKKPTTDIKGILEYNWKPINEMLEYILKTSDNETQIEQTLNDICSLGNVIGRIGLSSALTEIVKKLCLWEISNSVPEFSYKRISILNAVFKVAHSLNGVLDRKAWMYIFQVLKALDHSVYSSEEEAIDENRLLVHFNGLVKEILENFTKYLPKDLVREEFKNSPKELNTLGDANEVLVQLSRCTLIMNDEEQSPAMKLSMTIEDEDRKAQVQEIRSIKVKGSMNSGLKGRDINTKSLIHPHKDIDFQKLCNAIKKNLVSKDNEIEGLNVSLKSLFVFSLLFDVLVLYENRIKH